MQRFQRIHQVIIDRLGQESGMALYSRFVQAMLNVASFRTRQQLVWIGRGSELPLMEEAIKNELESVSGSISMSIPELESDELIRAMSLRNYVRVAFFLAELFAHT